MMDFSSSFSVFDDDTLLRMNWMEQEQTRLRNPTLCEITYLAVGMSKNSSYIKDTWG